MCYRFLQCNEISKSNSNITVIGKATVDNDKEDYDNELEEDDADHGDESDGEDFEQETSWICQINSLVLFLYFILLLKHLCIPRLI